MLLSGVENRFPKKKSKKKSIKRKIRQFKLNEKNNAHRTHAFIRKQKPEIHVTNNVDISETA